MDCRATLAKTEDGLPRCARKDGGWIATLRSQRRLSRHRERSVAIHDRLDRRAALAMTALGFYSNPDAIAPDFFVGRKLSHGPLEADLAFFEHIGTV